MHISGPTGLSNTTRDSSSSSPDVTALDMDEAGSSDDEGGKTRGDDGEKGGRRRRTAFTSEQLLELEKEFHAKKYLSLTERSQIAHALKLSEVRFSKCRCKKYAVFFVVKT